MSSINLNKFYDQIEVIDLLKDSLADKVFECNNLTIYEKLLLLDKLLPNSKYRALVNIPCSIRCMFSSMHYTSNSATKFLEVLEIQYHHIVDTIDEKKQIEWFDNNCKELYEYMKENRISGVTYD